MERGFEKYEEIEKFYEKLGFSKPIKLNKYYSDNKEFLTFKQFIESRIIECSREWNNYFNTESSMIKLLFNPNESTCSIVSNLSSFSNLKKIIKLLFNELNIKIKLNFFFLVNGILRGEERNVLDVLSFDVIHEEFDSLRLMEEIKKKVKLQSHKFPHWKSRCFWCNKIEPNNIRFKKCSRCKHSKYCSVKCQRKDWEHEHKKLCKKLKM